MRGPELRGEVWLHSVMRTRYLASREPARSEERRVGEEGTCRRRAGEAVDGIRDTSVTGVQTCALPISSPPVSSSNSLRAGQLTMRMLIDQTPRCRWFASDQYAGA